MINNQNNEPPKSEKVVNDLLYQIECNFKKKYRIKTIATNVSMPGGVVQLLGLDFQIYGPLSKEEIRKILINMAQDFILYINSCEKIKPYLKKFPFGIENIDITLLFIDSNGFDLDYPYISIAEISHGKIVYKSLIKINNIPSIKSKFEESYEEALKTILNQ